MKPNFRDFALSLGCTKTTGKNHVSDFFLPAGSGKDDDAARECEQREKKRRDGKEGRRGSEED